VWLVDKKRGSFPVPCTSQRYADGLTLHQHRVIRQHHINKGRAGRIYRRDLMIAKAELLALGQKMLGQKSSRNFRQQLARYFGGDPKLVVEAQQRLFDAERSRQTYAAEMAATDEPDEEVMGEDEEDILQANPKGDAAPIGDAQGKPVEAFAEEPVEEPAADAPRRRGRPKSARAVMEGGEDAQPKRRVPRHDRSTTPREAGNPTPPASRPDMATAGERPSNSSSHVADPDPTPASASDATAGAAENESNASKVVDADDTRSEAKPKRKVRYGGGFQRAGD